MAESQEQLFLEMLAETMKHTTDDIKENQQSLKIFPQFLFDIIEGLADARIPVTESEYHIQSLNGKIIFTTNSIIKLCEGDNLQSLNDPNKKTTIIDSATINTLTRSLVENYLTLYYLYNKALTEAEKHFRFLLWKCAGLKGRQHLNPVRSEEIIKKKKEGEEIKLIMSQIESSDTFSKLNSDTQKRIRAEKPYPKVLTWEKLIDEHLNKDIFRTIYTHYSSYAHTEYISALQLSQTNLHINSKHHAISTVPSLMIVRSINCLAIQFYIENYADAKNLYDKMPENFQMLVSTFANIALNKTEIKTKGK